MSGRTHGAQRVTVESCARFDVGMIRRAGLLAADARGGHQWTYSARGAETLRVIVSAKVPGAELLLMILRPGEREPSNKLTVRVSWSSCHYGGRRAWLSCPRCGRRCWRLYCYPHTVDAAGGRYDYFGCRRCAGEGVSYELRNVRGRWLSQSRAGKIVKKLGGDVWDELPAKPRWMRWPTYSRLALKWREAVGAYNSAFVAKFAYLLGK